MRLTVSTTPSNLATQLTGLSMYGMGGGREGGSKYSWCAAEMYMKYWYLPFAA